MNRLLIVLLFASVAASGQSNLLTKYSGGNYPVYGSTTNLVMLAQQIPSRLAAQDTAALNAALRTLRNMPNAEKQFKATYSDYVTLPRGAGGVFEFHDHEATTTSGSIVGLSTYILSGSYSNKLPADLNNGATIIQHAIFSEKTIGAGNIPWLQANAPEASGGVNVQLNTFANLNTSNYNGTIKINTPDGNTFQMSTSVGGAQFGWTKPDSSTKLMLTAGSIYATGQFTADGLLTSHTGLIIGDSNVSGWQFSSTSLTLTDDHERLSIETSSSWNSAFLVNSNSPGGIVFSTVTGKGGYDGPIMFAPNSNIMASITSNGFVIGNGLAGSSAILTLISTNKGFIPPKLTDDQIFGIDNPDEGVEVYSIDHHAPAFFNGTCWMLPSGYKKLIRGKITSITD